MAAATAPLHRAAAHPTIKHVTNAPMRAARAVNATKSPPTLPNAQRKPTTSTRPPHPLLSHTYQPHPHPINTTTHFATRIILTERDHPSHLAVRRRHAAFDPTLLHWNVAISMEISKKAVVRNWARRRVKEAFAAELKAGGWGVDGRVLAEGEGVRALGGALCLKILPGGGVLRASGEEVRGACGRVLRVVVGRRGMVGEKEETGRKVVGSNRDMGKERVRATGDREVVRLVRTKEMDMPAKTREMGRAARTQETDVDQVLNKREEV